MDKTEKRICWYSSLLITLMMNSAKLMALRENGILARYWHFNLTELLFQAVMNMLFCFLIFYLNLQKNTPLSILWGQHKGSIYYLINAVIIMVCFLLIGTAQAVLFKGHHLPRVYWIAYIGRFGVSTVLIGIMIKIILLLREGKQQASENEQLKSAYMAAELELLKEQMNPHFLFNSLSSLSGVIREDPVLAQKYVRELSNVFRYTIAKSKANLVTLEEELTMLRSFAQLITMRLENAFMLHINVDSHFYNYKLPHLSLQPLLENAVKHNAATKLKPLIVDVYMQAERLVVSNTVCEIPQPESSNSLGLANLNERFKMMVQAEIEVERTNDLFIVKLPLKA
jgi:two-component system LytT family sensor kinase